MLGRTRIDDVFGGRKTIAGLFVALALSACTTERSNSGQLLPETTTTAEDVSPPPTVDPEQLEAAVTECAEFQADAIGVDFDGIGYCLGPVFASADDLESVSSELGGSVGIWDTLPVFTESGIEQFNVGASLCFERSAECPTRRVAIMSGDRVFSAPSILTPSFMRDQIIISGSEEMSGQWLAKRIESSDDTGRLEFRFVLSPEAEEPG